MNLSTEEELVNTEHEAPGERRHHTLLKPIHVPSSTDRTGMEHLQGPARVCHLPFALLAAQFVVCVVPVTECEGVKSAMPPLGAVVMPRVRILAIHPPAPPTHGSRPPDGVVLFLDLSFPLPRILCG